MYNYINDDVKLDFEIPKSLVYLIEMCEKYDQEDNYGAYNSFADFLTEVASKELYVKGVITKEQWDTIDRRYVL